MSEMESQIGFSDEFGYGSELIKYNVSRDGKLGLAIEDCARALGITDSKILKDDSVSTTVRWNRVYEDLVGIGVLEFIGTYSTLDNRTKKKLRDKIKCMTLDINSLFIWCNNVDTHKSNNFMQFLKNINMGHVDIIKEMPDRKELEFFKLLVPILKQLNIAIELQYGVLGCRVDGYIKELKIAIEYDENGHKYYSDEKHIIRQQDIENELGCEFIRVTDSYDYGTAIGIVISKINSKLYEPMIKIIDSYNDVNNKNDDGSFIKNNTELLISKNSFNFEKSISYNEVEDCVESHQGRTFNIESLVKSIIKHDEYNVVYM